MSAETGDTKERAYTTGDIVIYASSVIAIWTFMFHFWWPHSVASFALWGIAGAFAIFSIFGGIVRRHTVAEGGTSRGLATAAAVVGCLVILGLTVSAVTIFVPMLIANMYM